MDQILVPCKAIVAAITSDAYLSTRISSNESIGWEMEENIKLAHERADAMQINVLNPAQYQVPGWRNDEYMTMWRVVIRLMGALGKPMISFKEDIPWSSGCTEEVDIAQKIGMKLIQI